MTHSANGVYPNCPTIMREVQLGLYTKSELIQKLKVQNIKINELGKTLLNDNRFTFSKSIESLATVELQVRNLGFPDGATLLILFRKAEALGLHLCPLEVGPLLRLMDTNQEEGAFGQTLTKNQAPSGSYTIASPLISIDDAYPKGIYLRKIKGDLWLRGYTCDYLHVFSPGDRFVFCR